jgi:hypothetical protein
MSFYRYSTCFFLGGIFGLSGPFSGLTEAPPEIFQAFQRLKSGLTELILANLRVKSEVRDYTILGGSHYFLGLARLNSLTYGRRAHGGGSVFTVAVMGELRGLSKFFSSGLLIKGFMNPIIFKSILNAIAFHFIDGYGVDG